MSATNPLQSLPASNLLSGVVSLLIQEGAGALSRVWSFLTREFPLPGDRKVSIVDLVLGLTIFVLAVLISRSANAVIQRRIRTQIDPSLRFTIARLVSYIIVALGVLLALKAAFKLDLTSIAVIFGALSFGIGFGLQYIAADIASGFILLFERPVRIGDRITIGEDEGDVESINLRTTIVLTNDRISIIVPNSRLVSQRVINWSYGEPEARIPVPIGVSYGSDVELVTKTLLRAAEDINHVLTDPPPKVQFLGFGDYSLDFRLLVWSRRPRYHLEIKSEINYRIDQLFREAGIQIPFPTRQLLFEGKEKQARKNAEGPTLGIGDQ